MSKALGTSSATAQVIPDLLKTLAILSDKLSGDLLIEKTQNHTRNQKKGHICLGDNNAIIYIFFQIFYYTQKDLSPTFLNTRDYQWDLSTIWKIRLLQTLIEKFSNYESSGSQFFRNTTGIQSGPDAFDTSRFFMIFLTISGVTETLCCFRLVLEGKTGKEVLVLSRSEFLKKFLANNSALSDTEDNTSRPFNRGNIHLSLLRMLLTTCLESQEPSFSEVMHSFVLLTYTSLKASRTLLQWLIVCVNFTLDSEDLLLVQTKKVISMNYSSSTSSWKPWRWVRLDLILTMRDIYISSNLKPLTKFTSNSRSTEFKDIFPWNISQMITKTVPISTRIVISYAMKQDIPLWVL